VRFASHFSPRLLDEVDALSERAVPIAEINRRVGAKAQRLGVTKPSYERVRQLVHEARDLQRGYVSALEIFIDFATHQQPMRTAEKLANLPARPRLRDRNRL
jgi:hypothetical protein